MNAALCTFTATDRLHEYRCARCGLIVVSPHGPERVFSRCVAAADGDPGPPMWLDKAWNLAGALSAFVADGLRTVDESQYEARLQICNACPQRRHDTCTRCGCRLSLKARGRAFVCPLGKWPA